jgi:hypothetical protein
VIAFGATGYTGVNTDTSASYRNVVQTINGPLDEVRVRFVSGTNATLLYSTDHCSIGRLSGAKTDTLATPVELTFGGGQHGFKLGGGASRFFIWSDWIAFNGWTAGDSLVVISDNAADMTECMRWVATAPAGSNTLIFSPGSALNSVNGITWNVASPGTEDFNAGDLHCIDTIEVRKTPVLIKPKGGISFRRRLVFRKKAYWT